MAHKSSSTGHLSPAARISRRPPARAPQDPAAVPAARRAACGAVTAEHAALLQVMLERIDRVNAKIARLTGVIERLLTPV